MSVLKLRAEDGEDLKIIGAYLQDAILPVNEMHYHREDGKFVFVVNRFKWENAGEAVMDVDDDDVNTDGGEPIRIYERTHCAVRFDGVKKARFRGFDLRNRDQVLELLAMELEEGPSEEAAVILHFAGGACVRLDVEAWRCCLQDVGEPWPTTRIPRHVLEDDANAA